MKNLNFCIMFSCAAVFCFAADAAPERFALSSPAISVEVRSDTLALTVTDRRTGRVWEPYSKGKRPSRYSLRNYEADDGQIRLDVIDNGTKDALSIVYQLDGQSPAEFTVTIEGKGGLARPMAYPAPFAGREGDMMILPLSEGYRLPMHEKTLVVWEPPMWSASMSMEFFGVEEDATGAGWMAIAETRNDAKVHIVNRNGKPVAIGPSWAPERRQYGYPRMVRYVFFDRGGYVAMAGRYRQTAKEQGLVKTFREKAKARPAVDRLLGAANVWYYQAHREPSPAKVARELKAAGIDRFLWSQNCSETNVAQIAALPDVLVGRYDCYRDIYRPEPGVKRDRTDIGADICRNTDAWPDAAIWNSADSNDLRKAWGYTGKDGKKHYCIAQCTLCQPANLRRHMVWEMARKPFSARFIDVATAVGAEECENPAHPMTRTQSRVAMCDLFQMLCDEFGLVTGGEQGVDYAVPWCDYFEGMMSPWVSRMPHGRPGAQRPDIFREGLNPTNVTPDEISKVVTYHLGEKYRIPLFELVYHDCCCSHWYWYDYSNRPISFWAKRDLFNVLYGTAPMYIFDYRLWSERKEMFVKSYRKVCPVARRTGYSRMVDHRALVPDRSVQRSTFEDGTVVTVNFGENPYRLEDGTDLAPMDSHARFPPAGKCAAAASAECAKPITEYEPNLQDRCWMFGHDPGQHDRPGNVFNIPPSSGVSQAEACRIMGVSNLIVCIWSHPGEEYRSQFKGLKRVSWAVENGWTRQVKKRDVYAAQMPYVESILKTMPNLMGADFDDFFYMEPRPESVIEKLENGSRITVAAGPMGVGELRGARKRIASWGRPIDMRIIVYSRDIPVPGIKPVIDVFDTVQFWTWDAADLARLRENFTMYRKMVPDKPTLLGIYMWDFGGKKPVGVDVMRGQLDFALEKFRGGEIDGVIFHCTPLVDKNIPEVEMCRKWIAEHGRETIGRRDPSAAKREPFPMDMPLPELENNGSAYNWLERHQSRVKLARTTNPQIVFIGDSITHGWEMNDMRGDAKASFERWFGKYSTLNLGFGWDRIQNVLWRLEHGELDGTAPKVVVVHIGTNNTAPGHKFNAAPNPPGEIADGILAVCRKVRKLAPNARIVLMKVFPRGKTAADAYRGKVAAVNAELDRRLVGFHDDRLTVIDMHDKFVDADGNMSLDLTIDYLHPNAKGYDLWGAALAPIIEKECD